MNLLASNDAKLSILIIFSCIIYLALFSKIYSQNANNAGIIYSLNNIECLTFSHIVFSIKLANSLSFLFLSSQNATSFNEIPPKQLEISLTYSLSSATLKTIPLMISQIFASFVSRQAKKESLN